MVISNNNNNKIFCATKKNKSFFKLLYFRGGKMSLGWDERDDSFDGEELKNNISTKPFFLLVYDVVVD